MFGHARDFHFSCEGEERRREAEEETGSGGGGEGLRWLFLVNVNTCGSKLGQSAGGPCRLLVIGFFRVESCWVYL